MLMLLILLIIIPPLLNAISLFSLSRQQKPIMNTTWPKLSILVAAKNEALYITACMQSLMNLDYPASLLEIIIIDDHSSDDTYAIASALSHQSPCRIQVLNAPDEPRLMGSKKRATSFGITHATGDILLFTDADGLVSRQWAKTMARYFSSPTVGFVSGASIPPIQKYKGLRLYRLERIMISLTTALFIGLKNPAIASGQNIGFRKQAFLDIGGYPLPNTPAGEDGYMIQAIHKKNWDVLFAYTPDAVVVDRRCPGWQDYIHASTRHLASSKNFPLSIKALFLLGPLSIVALIGLVIYTMIEPTTWPLLVFSWIAHIALTNGTLLFFIAHMKIPLSAGDIFIGNLLSIPYPCFRLLFLLKKQFQWKDTVWKN